MVKPCHVRKGPWEAKSDVQALAFAPKRGPRNSLALSKNSGHRKCGRSCRLNWTDLSGSAATNYGGFTPEEEELIIKMHAAIGSRWTLIAQQFEGKTESDVKLFWNSKLKKRLSDMGIDHVTHRPFSHVLADYGNINVGTLISNPSNPIGSLHRSKKQYSLAESENSTNPNYQVGESGDILSHLYAIKSMTVAASSEPKRKTSWPDLNNDEPLIVPASTSSLSLSSSSRSCSTTPQESTDFDFTWSDFLLDEEILQDSHPNPKEHENPFVNISEEITTTTVSIQKTEGNPSDDFVESIITKVKDMYSGFPNYFGQSYYE